MPIPRRKRKAADTPEGDDQASTPQPPEGKRARLATEESMLRSLQLLPAVCTSLHHDPPPIFCYIHTNLALSLHCQIYRHATKFSVYACSILHQNVALCVLPAAPEPVLEQSVVARGNEEVELQLRPHPQDPMVTGHAMRNLATSSVCTGESLHPSCCSWEFEPCI